MRLTWVQVEQLYLVPSAIQSRMEADAMKGHNAVPKESFVNAYREMKPEATDEQVERAWVNFSRGG